MKTVRTKVGEGGRVVLPAEFRRELGVCVGDVVWMRVKDGRIEIETPANAIAHVQAWTRAVFGEDRSLVDEVIAERRAEAARE